MKEQLLQEQIEKGAQLFYGGDAGEEALYSMNPPETIFGYSYHSHLIPPFKPETCLILGYGQGTVAQLIRKIWGDDIKITGVDTDFKDCKIIEYKKITMDAHQYIQDCTRMMFKKRFDYIVVDLWNGHKVPEWIFEDKTAAMLRQMTKKLLAFNIPHKYSEKMHYYKKHEYHYDRADVIDGNAVLFFSVPIEE